MEIFPGAKIVCPSIGTGSYGEVFKAVDPSTHELLAIKTMRTGSRNSDIDHEFNMQQKCSPHRNICAINYIADGPEEKTRSLVMEFAGTPLSSVRELRLNESMLKCVAHQLFNGIAHMHKNGVVHRDIKTNNLMVDYCGTVRICDFGFAGIVGPKLGSQDTPDYVVTENYRPPEMLMGATNHGYVYSLFSLIYSL